MTDGDPIWTDDELMVWGRKMLTSGFLLGFSLAVVICSLVYLGVSK